MERTEITRHADARRMAELLDVSGSIFAAVDGAEPEQEMMVALGRIIPAWSATLNAITLRPNRLLSWTSRAAGVREATHPSIGQHLQTHPTLGRLITEPGLAPLRLADPAGVGGERRSAFVQDYYRPLGLRHQLTFAAGSAEQVDDGAVWIVGLNRLDGRDFNEVEIAHAELLRPQITRALAMLRQRRQRDALAAVRETTAQLAGSGTLAVNAHGEILDCTSGARELLIAWFPEAARGRLEAGLLRRLLPLRQRQGGSTAWQITNPAGARLRIQARHSPQTDWFGLWLRESRPKVDAELAQSLGITPRQAEIARWVAAGKTNGEVALILGLSPRTVEKHMEGILERLALENRAALAQLVREALDM